MCLLSFFLLSYLKLYKKEGNESSTTAYRQRLGTRVGHLETRKIQYSVWHRNFTILQIVMILLSSFQFSLFLPLFIFVLPKHLQKSLISTTQGNIQL